MLAEPAAKKTHFARPDLVPGRKAGRCRSATGEFSEKSAHLSEPGRPYRGTIGQKRFNSIVEKVLLAIRRSRAIDNPNVAVNDRVAVKLQQQRAALGFLVLPAQGHLG